MFISYMVLFPRSGHFLRGHMAFHGHKVTVECVFVLVIAAKHSHSYTSPLCSCRLVVLMWLCKLTTVMECTSETSVMMPTTFQS